MKLVWHAERLFECDWLLYILGDVVDKEITDLGLTCFDDDALHVISSNVALMRDYENYFQQCRARCKHIVLIHVSDEAFSGGYGMYRYFDLVVRWNHSWLTDESGILTVPVGYRNNTGNSMRPADERQYAWSFAGNITSSRFAMAKALETFAPHFMTYTGGVKGITKNLSKAEFDAVLENTVFAPCPMGNATIETTRVYESLELGCIPLVELRLTLDYYGNLLGPNPIPAFRSWPEARRFAEHLYQDKPSLLAKQAEVMDWWRTYKPAMCAQAREAIIGPSRSADLQHYAAKLRNRFAVIHEPLRIIEILRHQTVGSLLRRLSRPAGPLARIVANLRG